MIYNRYHRNLAEDCLPCAGAAETPGARIARVNVS